MSQSPNTSELLDTQAKAEGTFDCLPRHIAIIMDGNGRWAQQRNLPRTEGHRRGAEVARNITLACARMGIEVLTLYSFSTENWKRPAAEIEFLMKLGEHYLHEQSGTVHEQNIRFRHVGQREGLNEKVLQSLDRIERQTADNSGMTLALALNYGSRGEITEAVRSIAADVAAGRLEIDQVDEQAIERRLFTAGLPDPDLLIRTAGEMRISNFLLWQISYSELWITDRFWPDFGEAEIREAIAEYAQRRRRFGGVETDADPPGASS